MGSWNGAATDSTEKPGMAGPAARSRRSTNVSGSGERRAPNRVRGAGLRPGGTASIEAASFRRSNDEGNRCRCRFKRPILEPSQTERTGMKQAPLGSLHMPRPLLGAGLDSDERFIGGSEPLAGRENSVRRRAGVDREVEVEATSEDEEDCPERPEANGESVSAAHVGRDHSEGGQVSAGSARGGGATLCRAARRESCRRIEWA